jgi:hypothetical protein
MARSKSEKIEFYVESAFSVYLDIIRDEIERAEEQGDFKRMVELEKELIQLKERR